MKWIKTSERTPRKDGKYLGYRMDLKEFFECYYHVEGDFWRHGSWYYCDPDYWLKVSPPIKENESNE